MTKRDKNQIWCTANVTPEESRMFWEHWSATQWGMPTFQVMRDFIELRRARQIAA